MKMGPNGVPLEHRWTPINSQLYLSQLNDDQLDDLLDDFEEVEKRCWDRHAELTDLGDFATTRARLIRAFIASKALPQVSLDESPLQIGPDEPFYPGRRGH